jgi:YD repeat-containing protein
MNYDAFGRVIATEHLYAQGATSGNPISTTHQDRWTNAFDDQQRLVATTSPTGFIHYQYDDFGRKKATESGTTGSTVLSEVTYAYDALSRLSTLLTVRRDGLPVDSSATLSDNQPEATRYHFDLLGRPDYTELPNGVVEDYVFDNMDRLDLMQHFQSDSNNADLTDNALKNMFDYSYRADGKRVGLVERFDTSGNGNALDYRDRFTVISKSSARVTTT